MKTRWVISGSVFLLAMALLLVLLTAGVFRHRDNPCFSMVFGGLTKRFGRMEAQFWTTNGSLEAFNQITEISRMVGGAWTNEARFLQVHVHPFRSNFRFVQQPHEAQLTYVPVHDLSSPLRVVMLCRERSSLGLWEWLETCFVKRTKNVSVVSLRGRSYFLTNEVAACAMTNVDEADLLRALLRFNGSRAAAPNNASTDELLRVWSSPSITVQERAQVVKNYTAISQF